MPFITETLWQRLPLPVGAERCEFLAIAPWPLPHARSADEEKAVARFDLVREAIGAIRQIRSDYAIPPGKPLEVFLGGQANPALFTENARLFAQLARAQIGAGAAQSEAAAHSILSDGSELIVPLAGAFDIKKECDKLRGELGQLDTQLEALSKRLQNDGFVRRAPAAVVESERRKEEEWARRREQLDRKVKALCGG
jgi:valyl-tRNA synthetase